MKNTEQRKLTISIGIPAHNEERNIQNVLKSVCSQTGQKAEIKEIIVLSDGSTDKTVECAKSVDDKRIKIIERVQRSGKPAVLNVLFRIFKGDILVTIDADMLLNDNLAVEKLVSNFGADKTVDIVSGNAQPLPPETFLESAINNYIYARNAVSDKYSIGNSAYVARGMFAYSRKFLMNFSLPEEILSDDSYCYFYGLKNNYKILHEKEAIALFRSPQTIKEHVLQSTRHLAGGIQLHKYFGPEMVNKGFTIPKMALIKIMLYQILANPLGYIVLKALNIYCHFLSRVRFGKMDIRWEAIQTSKKLHT